MRAPKGDFEPVLRVAQTLAMVVGSDAMDVIYGREHREVLFMLENDFVARAAWENCRTWKVIAVESEWARAVWAKVERGTLHSPAVVRDRWNMGNFAIVMEAAWESPVYVSEAISSFVRPELWCRDNRMD
jgi:hypothetical protein